MSRNFESWVALAIVIATPTLAQDEQEDLTLPPRILDATRPAQAELATPRRAPEDTVEEIIVRGDDNPWRLPDLGSEWRRREAEERHDGRIAADLLPLWDPEAEQPYRELFPVNSEMQRVGFIELFRVRFGRR